VGCEPLRDLIRIRRVGWRWVSFKKAKMEEEVRKVKEKGKEKTASKWE